MVNQDQDLRDVRTRVFPAPALSTVDIADSRRQVSRQTDPYQTGFDAGLSIEDASRSDYLAGFFAGIELRIRAESYLQGIAEKTIDHDG